MQAKGHNGQVTLEGEWLTIDRRGFGRLGHSKGGKRLRVAAITGIKMRPAGKFANGFIAFETTGHEFSGGLTEATRDDNAVIFTRRQSNGFDELRAMIEAN